MTDTKHTPGPWKADGTAVYAEEDGRYQEIIWCCNTNDATLTAASPTMLETLRSIAMIASCAPNDDPERADEQFEKIMNMANRAAKLAMGE